MRHFIVVALLVTTAQADTRIGVRRGEPEAQDPQRASVRLGAVTEAGEENATVERVSLALRGEATGVRATLRFRLSTQASDALELRIPIIVARGTQMIAMSYAVGGERPLDATFMYTEQ